MKKVTIINAFGDNNIGDATILYVALEIINAVYKKCEINLLIQHRRGYKKFSEPAKNIIYFQHPYGYAIQSSKNKASLFLKTIRFLKLYSVTSFLILFDLLSVFKIPRKGFYSYINAIKKADVVIGMGGGYFIARNPVTDYFGLMLSLLPLYIAKIYKKRIIFLPISFGPFASKLQEYITFKALENTTVMARDEITLREFKKLNKNKKVNAFYSPDLGIFFNNHSYDVNKKIKSNYIVLTARDWLSSQKQKEYEQALTSLVDYAWEKYKLKTVFISMARNIIEDNDDLVARRIKKNLKNKNIFHIRNVESLSELQRIIGLSRLAVCTRMHSAILALTVQAPFIAIGYGIKMLGLVKSYDLMKWYIEIGLVDEENIKFLLDSLIKNENYKRFIDKVKVKQDEKISYKSLIMKTIRT